MDISDEKAYRRRSRGRSHQLLAATAVVLLLGLVAIHAVVVAAIHPPLRELERIRDDHARAVSVATRMRSQLSDVRRRIVSAIEGSPVAPGPTIDGELVALGATASELLPVAESEAERRRVSELRAALDACAATTGRIERALRVGAVASARSDLVSFLEQAAQAGQAADGIVWLNVNEVRDSTESVRRAMLSALATTSILGLVVVAAALVLIRLARGAVIRYERVLDMHATEMEAFASRAAHELRGPLHVFGLTLASLRAGSSPRAIERAEANVRRLRDIIDALLEFSRSGAVPGTDAHADVAGVVAEVVEEVESGAADRHVALNIQVPRGLTVRMSPAHLRVVLSNVVTNAVKYGADWRGVCVDVIARESAESVDLLVRDTGPGIPPDALPRVFEPFFRASTRPGGYGLGLATVKRLVNAHGGRIDVLSASGRGTTVAIRLPLAATLAA